MKKDLVFKILLVLLILEVISIPFLVIAEVKRILPIIFFLVIPTILAIAIYLLGKNCLNSYEKKKNKIIEKLK